MRTSISSESPARSFTPSMSSESSATRSSSARAKITQRRLSSSCSLRVTTSPENSPSRTRTTLRLSFRTTSLPLRIAPGSMSGCRLTRILRPLEKTSTVPSSLMPEERAVGRRRLGELLDLLAQGGQLLLGLLQGEGQLLVLRGGLGQLALRLEEPLLEGLDPARGSPAAGGGARGSRPRRRPARRAALRPGQRLRRELRSRMVTLALAPAHSAGIARARDRCTGSAGPDEYAGGDREARLTVRGTPHYGPRGPSGGCDKGERQVHEGLDRPGSLHGRRAVRGDRARRLHPPRRRPGLREGRRRRQERPRAARPGWRPSRPTSRTPSSRPPRSAPASASSSSATSGLTSAPPSSPATPRRRSPRHRGRMRIVPLPLESSGCAPRSRRRVAPPAVDRHAVLPHAEVEPSPTTGTPACRRRARPRVGVLARTMRGAGRRAGAAPARWPRCTPRRPRPRQPSSRRAVVRNPVCPTMRWSGRTERASTCHVRRMISCVSDRPKGAPASSSAWRSSAVWLIVGR